MTLKKAAKILRSNNYTIGVCSNGTKRLCLWVNNQIVWDKYVKNDELKAIAESLEATSNYNITTNRRVG